MSNKEVAKDYGLVKMHYVELLKFLRRATETNVSAMLHGTFGIGKSFMVRELAKMMAKERKLQFSEDLNDVNKEGMFIFLPLILHQYEPGEIGGLVFPNADKTKATKLLFDILPLEGDGLIFFDEINLAQKLMQANAYQIIHEGRLGKWIKPKGYSCIGAGNLEDDRGHTHEMAMPLNNRFAHIHVDKPPVHDIEENGVVVARGWINGFAIPYGIDPRIINYLAFQGGHLHTFTHDPKVRQITCATPRTWAMASKMISGIQGPDSTLENWVGSLVGPAIALQWVSWLKLSATYDIKAIYEGAKLEIPKDAFDVLYSLISAIVSYYIEKPTEEKAVRFLELAMCFKKEHQVMLFSQAKGFDPDLVKRMRKASPKLLTKFSDEIVPLLIER